MQVPLFKISLPPPPLLNWSSHLRLLHSLPPPATTQSCSYDHTSLQFYLNGKCLDKPFTNVRGQVFPAVYTDNGAILDATFQDSDMIFPLPMGFSGVLFEKSIL